MTLFPARTFGMSTRRLEASREFVHELSAVSTRRGSCRNRRERRLSGAQSSYDSELFSMNAIVEWQSLELDIHSEENRSRSPSAAAPTRGGK